MAHKKITDVRQYATGTGTGALTLEATAISANYRTLQAAGMADADTAYVMIRHATIPTQWQIVLVAYTASGTTITPTFDSKSVSATGSPISFSAGNKIVSEARHDGVDWIVDRGTGPANVADFGAVADGTTDSLAAFEAAIEAGNGSIIIPAGTYLFSAEWEIARRQISVFGEARGLVILKFAAGGIVADIPTSLTTDIYGSVTFRNLTIMTDEAGASTGLKLLASAPTNMHPTLDNLEFIGSDGVHGPSQSVTGTSHTSTTIDGIASTAGILVNSHVVGSGVPNGAYVTAVGANSVTLNTATTTSTTATFTFNAGPQKYWDVGIDLDGAWFPSIKNIRISGGGAGRTTAGVYIHAGTDVAMFDYFMSHMEISGCTTAVLIDGQVEGLMLQQFDFYLSRDGIVATNAGALSVGTWQISGGTIYVSRNPISIEHFSTIQINDMAPVRGFAEFAWNPADSGVVYNSAFTGGFYYPGSNVSIVGATSLVQLGGLQMFNPFNNTENAIYLEDVDVFTINGVNLLTGIFTNGLNFQGTTSKGSFDNIVSYGTVTNPVVYGTTGYIRAGSFINGDNDATIWADARTGFGVNDATPSVKPLYGKNSFYTQNSSATTITQFDDAIPGQLFWVLINDSNTTLAHSSTLLLKDGVNHSPANGVTLTFLQEGTTYAREVARSSDRFAGPSAMIAFSADDTTPSVLSLSGKNYYYTANVNPTTIAQFDDAVVGQIWRVLINDSNTTLAHSANLLLQGGIDFEPPDATVLTFIQEGASYAREIARVSAIVVAASDIRSEANVIGLGVYAIPTSGDARVAAQATTASDYARHEAHIPAVVAWHWGSDSSAKWKLAANSTTFASPAITVDPSTNQVDLSGPLNVVNYLKTGAIPVSSLPAASVGSGAKWMVNDATATTFASVVAGGGSNHVPVFSDGTNWRIG